ncbi:MAG: diacylglycerol kinase family lipid kinase [Candidatus Acidiferrum sp.]
MQQFFAIVNPVAGGGRSAMLAGPALQRLRDKGLSIDEASSTGPGRAASLARDAYAQGYRRFLAVGGDGTAHEIINGIFSQPQSGERVALALLPFGTGNSFLRDFTQNTDPRRGNQLNGADASLQAVLDGRTRPIDLIRLRHAGGEIYSFNLLSVGFTADVAALTNRRFKRLGHLGYLLGVFVRLLQLHRRSFPLRCDDDTQWDERPALFLTFNNSKYTGGTMLIAPQADPSDGCIEFVRWGPIGRVALVRGLPTLYDGTHIRNPLASRRAIRHVEFNLPEPVDVTIDGEVVTVTCQFLDILPGAVDVFI